MIQIWTTSKFNERYAPEASCREYWKSYWWLGVAISVVSVNRQQVQQTVGKRHAGFIVKEQQ